MKRVVGRLSIAFVCLLGGIVTAWAMHRALVATRPVAPLAPAPSASHSVPAAAPAGAVLWVLAMGVSQYANPALNLRYAALDARGIAEVLATQSQKGLYREVRTRVLEDGQVTRESILDGLKGFLSGAGLDDTVVLFLAGHGVQEPSTGSYYFLPSPATPADMLTTGLRVSDLDQMIRALRAAVRGVVVLLDTCHAGALPIPAAGALSGEELVSRLSAAEGTFLLAASRAGEDSKELPEARHGAFSHALIEGLGGAADSDRDGLLPISELFGYVARRVPALTGGLQHPYHKMEGTDLVLASTDGHAGAALVAAPRAQLATNTIGVIELRNLRDDERHSWMGKALRVAFNTELSKVGALRVYVPQLIDRTALSSQADDLTVARRLGIHTLITGSYHVVGDTLRIDAEIVDVTTGTQQASDSVEGKLEDFFQLQKTLVVSILRRLQVRLSPEEGKSIEATTNTNVDAYRLLLESEGVVGETAPTEPTPTRHSSWSPKWPVWSGVAYAQEPDEGPGEASAERVKAEVLGVLEEFRQALESKDTGRLARVYSSFSERHREALQSYFDNAQGLSVEILNVAVELKGGEALVSYTRRDHFTDRQSNKPVQLEARLAKRFVREGSAWKIGGAQ